MDAFIFANLVAKSILIFCHQTNMFGRRHIIFIAKKLYLISKNKNRMKFNTIKYIYQHDIKQNIILTFLEYGCFGRYLPTSILVDVYALEEGIHLPKWPYSTIV